MKQTNIFERRTEKHRKRDIWMCGWESVCLSIWPLSGLNKQQAKRSSSALKVHKELRNLKSYDTWGLLKKSRPASLKRGSEKLQRPFSFQVLQSQWIPAVTYKSRLKHASILFKKLWECGWIEKNNCTLKCSYYQGLQESAVCLSERFPLCSSLHTHWRETHIIRQTHRDCTHLQTKANKVQEKRVQHL